MRSKHLLLFFAVLVAGGFTAVNTVSFDRYQANGSTAKFEVKDNLKSIQTAKSDTSFYVDTSELQDIRNNLKAALSNQSGGNLNWSFVGPNNVAGRIRTILIDNDEHNVLYAGGVSGGIFKSTTNGQYWEPVEVNYDASVISVTALVQASDGTIYATTGETFDSVYITKQSVSSYAGAGVFKKAPDSDVFEQLASTEPIDNADFFGITEIAIDPTDESKLYVTTWRGVYKSEDAGSSWAKINELPSMHASDIKISENGVIVVSSNGQVFVNSGSGFEDVSGHEDNMIDSGGIRYEFAFAPTNPDYLYSIAADSAGQLLGIYRSESAGASETWEKIASGGSQEFQLFRRSYTIRGNIETEFKGEEAMMIAVSYEDPNYVYAGGQNLWAGYKVSEDIEPFQWIQKTYNSFAKYHPQYVSPNMHTMIAQENTGFYFIATDGGVFRYHPENGSVRMNNYLVTGQFYDISYGPNGAIIAGSQANGMFINQFDGPGSQRFFGTEIIEEFDFADGARSGYQGVFSQINPNIFLYAHSEARLRRTLDFGQSIKDIYDSLMTDINNVDWDVYNAPMAMWESEDYPYGYDTYSYKTFDTLFPGDVDTTESRNIANMPIYITIEDTIPRNHSVTYEDPYKSIFTIGIKGQLWMSHKATSNLSILNHDWLDIFNIYDFYNIPSAQTPNMNATINDIAFSPEGHHLYLAINVITDTAQKSEIFRIDSLHTVVKDKSYGWSYINANDTLNDSRIREYTQKLGQTYTQEITSVAIDPNNKGRLIVTFSNYDDQDKVYVCDNVNTTTSNVFANNFRSIQGNLPKMPVFDAIVNVAQIDPETGNNIYQLILGTEMGVWTTNDYRFASPSYKHNSSGVGSSPVLSIEQQTYSYEMFQEVENYGILYMATFGNGLFVDSTYYEARLEEDGQNDPETGAQAISEFNANVYPNPVGNQLTVSFGVSNDNSNVNARIIDLSGRVLYSENMGQYDKGNHTYNVNTDNLEMGIYLFEINDGRNAEVIKIIKK